MVTLPIGQQPLHRLGKGVRVKRHNVAHPVSHQVGDLAAIRHDHGCTCQAGLHDRRRKGVHPAGEHKQIRVPEGSHHLRTSQQPSQDHPVLEVVLPDQTLYQTQLAVIRSHDRQVCVEPVQAPERLYQHVGALFCMDASQEQDQVLVGRDPELPPEDASLPAGVARVRLSLPNRRHGGSFGQIQSVGDDLDPLLRHAAGLCLLSFAFLEGEQSAQSLEFLPAQQPVIQTLDEGGD